MLTLMMVCEAAADFRIASGLVDRVLAERGPSWFRELVEDNPEAARSWRGDGERSFFDIHRLDEYCRAHEVRLQHGHFNGKPGGAGAQAARNTFLLARKLSKKGIPIDAVLLIWDMDGAAGERKPALHQARTEAEAMSSFKIVLGCPDAMSEAWHLAGFVPRNESEHESLRELCKELGFSPVEQSHQLDASSSKESTSRQRTEPLAKKSAKRVLDKLTGDDSERVHHCWRLTPLETLAERGAENGLASYLEDVEQVLLPLCAPTVRPTAS